MKKAQDKGSHLKDWGQEQIYTALRSCHQEISSLVKIAKNHKTSGITQTEMITGQSYPGVVKGLNSDVILADFFQTKKGLEHLKTLKFQVDKITGKVREKKSDFKGKNAVVHF
jgi:hypothetical protein